MEHLAMFVNFHPLEGWLEARTNRAIDQLVQTDEFSQLISLNLDSDNPPAGEPHRGGQNSHARKPGHTTVPPADQPRMPYPCGPCHMTQHALFGSSHDTHATQLPEG